MNSAEFEQLPEVEKEHFYKCKRCGEMVDKRQLDDVLFHEDHKPRPDIQYTAGSGSTNEGDVRLRGSTKRRQTRVYTSKIMIAVRMTE
jgi:hypothetical protein